MSRRRAAGVSAVLAIVAPLTACAASSGGAAPWAAATVVAAAPDLPDDEAAVALLREADAAARSSNFTAVVERVGVDGRRDRLFLRHSAGAGTDVSPVGDDTNTRRFADDRSAPSLPGALRHIDVLVRRFAIVLAGNEEILGRRADVVEARDSRGDVDARFWVDRTSGLLVRRDLIDATTGQRRMVAFIRLARTPDSSRAAATSPAATTVSAAPALDDVAIERLRTEGWVCPRGLPGGLELMEAAEAPDGGVHLLYGDGLDEVSLFVQRGRLDAAGLPGMARHTQAGGLVLTTQEPTPTWVWSSTGSVLTLMTEAPATAVDRIVAALPPDPE